ncbi:Peptidyl-alpha-hydroxyglycine alpha-amidating lyase 2 [Nymphon striatum]|nr:Peptidyl-alpha-hydroxyglycine alpha-amidating lyase 2 [Nymphon striatum]
MCPACTNVWVRDLGNYRYPVEKFGECPKQYGKKDPSTFNDWMQYTKVEDGPIKEDAVAVLNKTGHIIRSWGSDIFYMPHGMTVDEELTTWVTDVALHQVMKFPKGAKSPSLVLGNKLTPGRSVYSFCMPTDVMVDSDGNIYVSDGYCNSRIIMFKSNGEFLKQWGSEDRTLLYIPHSLTLMKRRSGDILCVADRENQRVICYQGMNDGAPWAVRSFATNGKVFAIDHVRNTIYGATYDGNEKKSSGFSFDTLKWKYTGQWNYSQGIIAHGMAMDQSSSLVIANIKRTHGMSPLYKVDLEVTNHV